MRFKFRSVLVPLVAVFALSAAMTASASASLPQLRLSEAGSMSLYGGTLKIEGSKFIEVKCTHTAGPTETGGSLWTKTLGKTVLEYSGCTTQVGGTCTSVGASAGVIKTNSMQMELFYLSKAAHEVGLVINHTSSGEAATLMTFTCTVAGVEKKYALRGTALAKVTPINTKVSTFTISLTGSKGMPTLKAYENEAGEKFSAKLEAQESTEGKWQEVDLNAAPLDLNLNVLAEIVA